MALDITRAALGWARVFIRYYRVVILSPRVLNPAVLERIGIWAIPQRARLSRDKAALPKVVCSRLSRTWLSWVCALVWHHAARLWRDTLVNALVIAPLALSLLTQLLGVWINVRQLLIARFAKVIALANVLDAILTGWEALHALLFTAVS